jgi:hypothetical protein
MLLQYSFVVLPALLQHRSIVVQIIKQGADFNIVVLPLNTTPLSSMSSAVLCARQILCKNRSRWFQPFCLPTSPIRIVDLCRRQASPAFESQFEAFVQKWGGVA